MKLMALTGIRKMEILEVPDLRIINDTDVLIKIKMVGVCGSDMHYYTTGRIGTQVVNYPYAVGHECAGIIIETGKAVKGLEPGQRVAIDPAMPCFSCDQCLSGREHTCRSLRFLGSPGQADGCLSEYIVMPYTSCIAIPDKMTFEEAVLSEPVAIGVYAVKKSFPVKNMNAGILGFGPIGMSVLLAAQAEGAGRIYVIDKISHRIAMARESGAYWAGNPDEENIVNEIRKSEPLSLDIVYECCGKQEALDQAIRLLKPGGKIMLIGIPEFDYWTLDTHEIRRKELTIVNVRRQSHCAHETIDKIAGGVLNTGRMTTHYFPFEKTKEAFDLVAGYKDGVMKAMIEFS